MTKNIALTLAFLTGIAMIFLGVRFFIAPETAEAAYGIQFNEQGHYDFHYIKAIRDVFTGLVLCILLLSKQTKALGIVLLVGAIIPAADMLIVLGKDYNTVVQAIPHISAIIICLLCGLILLRAKQKPKVDGTGFAQIIQSATAGKDSIIEYNIIPGERTPWHYHTLFAETFEVLGGTLEVGLGKQVHQLSKGDVVTVRAGEKHYFHNVSKEDCLLKVSVSPGNTDFERSLRILKGLARDGMASATGTPRNLSDLALFIQLNNSRMVGFQKLAEPLFDYVAGKAIRSGRLEDLVLKYG